MSTYCVCGHLEEDHKEYYMLAVRPKCALCDCTEFIRQPTEEEVIEAEGEQHNYTWMQEYAKRLCGFHGDDEHADPAEPGIDADPGL